MSEASKAAAKEPAPAKELDPKSQLEAAAVHDDKGRLRGHHVFKANGDLILKAPGVLSLRASVELGTYVDGLKEGEKLASSSDVSKRRSEVNAKRTAAGKPTL